MGFGNADFDCWQATGLEKPTVPGLKAEPEGDTGEWPAVRAVSDTQTSARALMEACLHQRTTLVSFGAEDMDATGALLPDALRLKLNNAIAAGLPYVIVDLSGVKSLLDDRISNSLGVFVAQLVKAKNNNQMVFLCDIPSIIAEEFRRANLGSLFSSQTNTDSALSAIRTLQQTTDQSPTPSGHP